MLAASKANNLATADAKPWHIKASFQIFDDSGAATEEGTYEEFWSSPTKFKRIFTGKAFAQTDYGSEKGDLRSGAQGNVPLILMSMRRDLVGPLPDERSIEHLNFSAKPLETGSLKLTCLKIDVAYTVPTYCLGAPEPILRIAAYPGEGFQSLHNRILRLDGHSIAGDIKFVRGDKVALTAHVDIIEAVDAGDQADFTPPPDAVLVPRRISISGGVAVGMLEYKVPAQYPEEARNAHITGTVVLQALIGKDGHIKELKAISGPDALKAAATDAVSQWRYRPYLLNSEPVEVMTTINVIFTLGN